MGTNSRTVGAKLLAIKMEIAYVNIMHENREKRAHLLFPVVPAQLCCKLQQQEHIFPRTTPFPTNQSGFPVKVCNCNFGSRTDANKAAPTWNPSDNFRIGYGNECRNFRGNRIKFRLNNNTKPITATVACVDNFDYTVTSTTATLSNILVSFGPKTTTQIAWQYCDKLDIIGLEPQNGAVIRHIHGSSAYTSMCKDVRLGMRLRKD